jgi:hypothetical protein
MPFSRSPAAYSILALIVVVSGLGLRSAPQLIERNLLRPYRVVRDRVYSTLITCGIVLAFSVSGSLRRYRARTTD